jgi:hypothetical protein
VHRITRWPKGALVGCAGVLAALGVASSLTQAASQTKATTKKVTCTAALTATTPLGQTMENFGTVTCPAPLGKGVEHATGTVVSTTSTTGSQSGGVKLFFNTGTLRGTQKSAFAVSGKAATYDGTMKISSGTGEFTGVTGSGTLAGTSDDGVHTKLTAKLTLKFPAKKTA